MFAWNLDKPIYLTKVLSLDGITPRKESACFEDCWTRRGPSIDW